METVDQATSVCGALHGQHWPPANPKTLSVNYSTTEDVSGVVYNLKHIEGDVGVYMSLWEGL